MNNLIEDYIFVSVSAFFISVIVTPVIRKICQKNSILDLPTIPRKIHTHPTPRLGGIAIYVAFFIPLFASLIIDGVSSELFRQNFDLLLSLFATSTLVFVLGVYDDIRGTTVVQKFSVQILAAVIIYFLGFKIDVIAMPFVDSLQLGILGLPVTILWIVGVTNAINFTDGIDGLACGVGFFSVSTIFILSLFLGHSLSAFLAAALAGGLFGFALYNFAPASIFMGDSGSLFIGFIIAAISLYSS
ncbi:MAG: undecaprenyl/decaprenyl-phosphate alpha-N-acetylglucosaminyl 1-phosphate transferase, partial [bacterium]|nr:undecaprenyl/decaprenyl-phosphate alpha-N-acetylglucosaminyl 1-phosphate transferase [bacterium]